MMLNQLKQELHNVISGKSQVRFVGVIQALLPVNLANARKQLQMLKNQNKSEKKKLRD